MPFGAALVLLVGLAVPLGAFLSQDSLIFFPQPLVGPGPASRPGLEEVEIAADDGTRLRGWFAKTPGACTVSVVLRIALYASLLTTGVTVRCTVAVLTSTWLSTIEYWNVSKPV